MKGSRTLTERLNGPGHEVGLRVFMAIVLAQMLVGLWILRPGFTGADDRRWWTIALGIQFFHHFEHALLQTQAILGQPFFGQAAPTSLVQLWVPRVELHLFYNTLVFIPMVVAMYHHMFPPPSVAATQKCCCAWHGRLTPARVEL